jgi:hypothetical protein
MLTGSILCHEAVAAATATLVRVARCYPRSASEAGTPSASSAAEIIKEARLSSPLPAGSTPYESARAAITLELLSTPGSAARLLNIARRFNADNNTVGGSDGGGDGDSFSALPGHDASPLAPSSLFPTETDAGTFVAQALRRWPTLGCGRRTANEKTSDFFVESVRQFGEFKSWLVSHGPNGDGSLIFDTDPKLERIWMGYRAKMQWAVDNAAFMFLAAFNVVALYRFHVVPLLSRSTDEQTDHDAAVDFDWFLLFPLSYLVCSYLVSRIIMNKYPEWYSRHRETIVMANRFFTPFFPLEKIYNLKAVLRFLRNTQYITHNLFTAFYPIRTDRHLFIQVANTIVVFLLGRGGG